MPEQTWNRHPCVTRFVAREIIVMMNSPGLNWLGEFHSSLQAHEELDRIEKSFHRMHSTKREHRRTVEPLRAW
ncbi:hypothetical protein [Thalassoglobus polymorphus]|uniref:hypothetical protein n=1 Tax=Thalassoglobus polymorphus TaxID=2527994 RepID=UPI0011A756C3|nr:hypothetical protein [Thalassoglobus polymorphus]